MMRISTITLVAIIVTATGLLTGCGVLANRSTVTEFDTAGNVVKVTETSESVVSDIVASTQSKTVVAWDNSWVGYIGVSAATIEDPTPTFKAMVGRSDKGVMTLHKDHDIKHSPAIIEAARAGEISLSATGISTSTVTTDTERQ